MPGHRHCDSVIAAVTEACPGHWTWAQLPPIQGSQASVPWVTLVGLSLGTRMTDHEASGAVV
jgi:hypothetical protein